MRINVYSQELTDETALVDKPGTDKDGNPAVFQGVRLYLLSSDQLHHTPEDDDRSAITIWIPKSKLRIMQLAETLDELAGHVWAVFGATPADDAYRAAMKGKTPDD